MKVTKPAPQPLSLHPEVHFQILRPLLLPLEARALQALHAIPPESSALSEAPSWSFDSIATSPGAQPLLSSGMTFQVLPSSEPPVLLLAQHPLPSFWIRLWYILVWIPSKPHARWLRQHGSDLHLFSSSETGADRYMEGTSFDPPSNVSMLFHHTALCLLGQAVVVDVGWLGWMYAVWPRCSSHQLANPNPHPKPNEGAPPRLQTPTYHRPPLPPSGSLGGHQLHLSSNTTSAFSLLICNWHIPL